MATPSFINNAIKSNGRLGVRRVSEYRGVVKRDREKKRERVKQNKIIVPRDMIAEEENLAGSSLWSRGAGKF